MRVVVDSTIRVVDYTKDVLNLFEPMLTFDNPEYIRRFHTGRWLGGTPPTISLIERQGRDLILPFGMLPVIFENAKLFPKNMIEATKTPSESFDFKSGITPYQYQEEAILAALRERQGVVVAPCGAGKTQIGLEIAARLGRRTLWLTHTSDLLRQSMERATANFGLKDSDYGTITGGKVDCGNVITFATVQTMSKIRLEEMKDFFDVVIVDECHRAVGSPTKVMMFYEVLSGLNARYKFGLTATPKRADGLTGCMYALLGRKVFEIGKDSVSETTCSVEVVSKETGFAPDESEFIEPDGTLNYIKLINQIVFNKERSWLIAKDAAEADGTCLVLTDRVSHVAQMCEIFKKMGVSVAGATGNAKKNRQSVIDALKTKKIKVLVATYALAKEGLDVPTLNNLFMATPQKNETTVIQSAGRVARASPGKAHGTIYDYCDDFNMLKSWHKKRISIYKRLGFKV